MRVIDNSAQVSDQRFVISALVPTLAPECGLQAVFYAG